MSDIEIPEGMPQWMADHIRQYVGSGGAEGHMWDSTSVGGPGLLPTLLLTTRGRRSGKARVMPLIYGESNGSYVIVASKGGAPKHPAWYLNLVSEPDVDIQVATKRLTAKARTASGAERQRLWDQMVEIYPPYADYQNKTDREIPVVVLDPVGSG
ncbi:MAG: nitroreductase family deazaflavin-dependent oxidoreductase [Pseudomonadota bacterium]